MSQSRLGHQGLEQVAQLS